MEERKPKFWKRIFAMITSAFLAIGVHGSQVASLSESYYHEKDGKRIESTELNDGLDSYRRGYPDFAMAGSGIISLEDILETPVDGEICDVMVPQGLTMTDKYILVSAYCGINGYKNELKLNSFSRKYSERLQEEENHERHHSVIYVYDRESKELLMTFELSDKNHVGGIAFDGKTIFVAKSTDKQVSKIAYDKVKRLVELSLDSGVKTAKIEYDETLEVNRDASFVTVREKEEEKELWVGTFSRISSESVIERYQILENGELKYLQTLGIDLFSQRSRFCKKRRF